MAVTTFLSGLPAILGIVGFFAYLWAGQYRVGGQLMTSIVEKLRAAPNLSTENLGSMTPARIEKMVKEDSSVRRLVNDQDIRTIRLIVVLQYVLTTIVLLVCAALVGIGIWLISRPEPLSIVPHVPKSALSTEIQQPLVDLDPIQADWDSKGSLENISVFLENIDSNARSVKKSVLADVRNVTFSPEELGKVATSRNYRGKNRIRTVIEWPGKIARSDAVDVAVGVKVQLMIGGTLVTPEGTRSINTLIATIDDSTEQMPPEYCFSVDFAGWNKAGPLVAPLKSCNRKSEVELPFLPQVDWGRHAGLVFNQPDADRLSVRTCIAGVEFADSNC
ncbi:hypothetical protein [Agrobacterium vitis]|uniref:hypothetical protein n=1 Tax=Agrobacterium vitis TaxID=373 RepID=UPI0012E9803B|nr:hypothetical protein [Agrobacterium vitis]MUZ65038.1 hypothetical protein [Agrobacterium vitis]